MTTTAKKILGGAIAGIALGVAASIFLSSKKGKALKETAKELGAQVKDSWHHFAKNMK